MASDDQNTDDSHLLNAKSFQRWCIQHAPALHRAVERRQHAAQVAEMERFAKARNAVISDIKRWMREGYTAAEAAGQLPYENHDRCGYSCTDLLQVLQELGIRRPGLSDRPKGGDA